MTRLIGFRWKRGDAWSREVLIGPSPFYVFDVTCNRCLIAKFFNRTGQSPRFKILKPHLALIWTSIARFSSSNRPLFLAISNRLKARHLVPIALGKYLFPFRTQQSSPVAPIILRERETRKVPNYQKSTLTGGFLLPFPLLFIKAHSAAENIFAIAHHHIAQQHYG